MPVEIVAGESIYILVAYLYHYHNATGSVYILQIIHFMTCITNTLLVVEYTYQMFYKWYVGLDWYL